MTSPEKMISSLSKRSPVLLSSTSKRSSELLSSTSRRSPVTRKSNATRKALYLQFSDELLTMSQPARPSANKNWYIACSLFGKIPIKYDPREKAHAQAYPYQRQIRIGPTFFTIRTLEDKILVLGHEVGPVQRDEGATRPVHGCRTRESRRRARDLRRRI